MIPGFRRGYQDSLFLVWIPRFPDSQLPGWIHGFLHLGWIIRFVEFWLVSYIPSIPGHPGFLYWVLGLEVLGEQTRNRGIDSGI